MLIWTECADNVERVERHHLPVEDNVMLSRYCLVVSLWLWSGLAAVEAGELPNATPESMGLSSAKLEKVGAIIQAMIDKKETAGTVTVVARHGKVILLQAQGMMDIEAGKPMQADTVFRIYSMSKPITTTAAMILFDEDKLKLDEPVSTYLPEFKNLRVYAGKNETVPAV